MRWRLEEGKVTVPERQEAETLETLGDTVARVVVEALYDIKSSRSEGPDTWYHTCRG